MRIRYRGPALPASEDWLRHQEANETAARLHEAAHAVLGAAVGAAISEIWIGAGAYVRYEPESFKKLSAIDSATLSVGGALAEQQLGGFDFPGVTALDQLDRFTPAQLAEARTRASNLISINAALIVRLADHLTQMRRLDADEIQVFYQTHGRPRSAAPSPRSRTELRPNPGGDERPVYSDGQLVGYVENICGVGFVAWRGNGAHRKKIGLFKSRSAAARAI